ncbi:MULTISPECIES: 50S ribosomal protein L29 [Marinilabiliaceae]|uniref:Large ribosomal subunit protein uL29 n=2 Tax=Marinilabiliaceae TaxID=558415 RepID=A0A1T5HQ06_9BACT|nr:MULTISPECIES: 50S ribosomal protein L29 [Marinilabiliaceae]ASB48472.1 50S ribosomal protein L29 [Alkalitalea saponilacus]TCO04030.1 large subunit ribosomal protein L29 [Natronoflexus pectinivorans]SKC22776.1 large subunit ribosomal protein L29 [Alkalitalea saponilacus]
MKTSEIVEMTISEIEERLDAQKAELTRMKLNHHISPLENPMKIRETRRNIARMLTILRQKQVNEK